MMPVFADSFYFFAILNPTDAAHEKAMAFSQTQDAPIITTAWVLTELADGLSASSNRRAFHLIIEELRADRLHTIVPASQVFFEKGVELYCARGDKQWSLTDCTSFVVMGEYGLTEALTGDHHFEQAGFTALLT